MDASPRILSPTRALRALRSPTLWGAAFAILLLGVLGGLGALFPASVLGRPLAAFPGVTFAGSFGSFGLGLALLGHATGRRRLFQVASLATATIGAAALLARAMWASTAPAPTTSVPGSILRDLPATNGILLLLGGLGLLALTLHQRRRLAHIVAGVCGSTVLLVAITVVIGRLSGFLNGTDGSLITGASVYELLAGGINGVALMRLAASFDAPTSRVLTWLPNAIGVFAALTVIVIWIALVDREEELMQQQIGLASLLASSSVRAELMRVTNWSERTAARLAVRSSEVDSGMIEQLRPLFTDETQPVVAAAWARTDTRGRVDRGSLIAVSPEPRYSAILRGVVEREVLAPIRLSSDRLRPFEFFPVPDESDLSVLVVRDCADAPCRAPFAVVIDARRAFRSLLTDSLTGFYLAVRLANQRVVRSGLSSQTDDKWLRTSEVDLAGGGARWQITVWPTPATLTRAHSDLPEGVLVLGLALAMLLPFTLRLADTAWSAAARSERARVNTALESATDSLWTWDIASDTIERSPALWSRLGYPLPKDAVPISAWVALVHPGDVHGVRQAMSRHLAGNAESLELEYRVRGADDQWHWLVERGRVVERSANGAPLRALGVTADITERKNGEEIKFETNC